MSLQRGWVLILGMFCSPGFAFYLVHPVLTLQEGEEIINLHFDDNGNIIGNTSTRAIKSSAVINTIITPATTIRDVNRHGDFTGTVGTDAFYAAHDQVNVQIIDKQVAARAFAFGINDAGMMTGCVVLNSGEFQAFVAQHNAINPQSLHRNDDGMICGRDIAADGTMVGEAERGGNRVLFVKAPDSSVAVFMANIQLAGVDPVSGFTTTPLQLNGSGQLMYHALVEGAARPFVGNLADLSGATELAFQGYSNARALAINALEATSSEVLIMGELLDDQGRRHGAIWRRLNGAGSVQAQLIHQLLEIDPQWRISQLWGKNHAGHYLGRGEHVSGTSALVWLDPQVLALHKGPEQTDSGFNYIDLVGNHLFVTYSGVTTLLSYERINNIWSDPMLHLRSVGGSSSHHNHEILAGRQLLDFDPVTRTLTPTAELRPSEWNSGLPYDFRNLGTEGGLYGDFAILSEMSECPNRICSPTVHVFHRSDGVWDGGTRLFPGAGRNNGSCCQVNSRIDVNDGILVVWPTLFGFGTMNIFELVADQWVQLQPVNNSAGVRMAKINQGRIAAWTETGGMDFYEKTAGQWRRVARIPAADLPVPNSRLQEVNFQWQGDRLVAAAGSGVHVFVRSGAAWSLQARLDAPPAASSALQFGKDVAVMDDTIFITDSLTLYEYQITAADTPNPFLADLAVRVSGDTDILLDGIFNYRIEVTNNDGNNRAIGISIQHPLENNDVMTLSRMDARCHPDGERMLQCKIPELLPGESTVLTFSAIPHFIATLSFKACAQAVTTDLAAGNDCDRISRETGPATDPRIVIVNPPEATPWLDGNVKLQYHAPGWPLGWQGHAIDVYLDGTLYTTIHTAENYPNITLAEVPPGEHIVKLQLVKNGAVFADTQLTIDTIVPGIEILSPQNDLVAMNNGIYRLAFAINGWPMSENGRRYRWTHGENTSEGFGGEPIELKNPSPGEHLVTLTLIDENGKPAEVLLEGTRRVISVQARIFIDGSF